MLEGVVSFEGLLEGVILLGGFLGLGGVGDAY